MDNLTLKYCHAHHQKDHVRALSKTSLYLFIPNKKALQMESFLPKMDDADQE
ncbi:hypothetical protein LG201_11795 [Methylobacillus gramineus]|uniref:hypothetical protein n=1 Tax=Methylobacillus gramineus TaxID=755169 RepID=UPI001CFFF13E|nr:hypothetical protein [Methylobacillus gramineus]MCB5185886.1 hypothetical protein [Methylobacillus gramineus]